MEKVSSSEERLRLSNDCQAFIEVANALSEEQFTRQIGEKWSVAEVMQHLYLSARPVVRLMTGPRDVLLQWGKPEWPSRTYEVIDATYQKVLSMGVKAPPTMTPRTEDMLANKNTIMERFTSVYTALTAAIGSWSDQELDEYVIPHPALGKLTVREMLHFTSAHTRHHLRLLPKV